MPHAGGGGGFHAAHSSGSRIEKYRPKSRPYYFVRPGYYFHNVYVPINHTARRRTLIAPIFGIICLLGMMLSLDIVFGCQKGKYSKKGLEKYAIQRYYDVYDSQSISFEYNLMVTIVTYADSNAYDYITIVGDRVASSVDAMFGNKRTLFGAKIDDTITFGDNYTNLYQELSDSIYYITDQISNKYYFNNTLQSSITNETKFNITASRDALVQAQESFYNKTGYQISVLVVENGKAYPMNVAGIVALSVVCSGFIAAVAYVLGSRIKAIKAINKAEEEGRAEDYFESGDTQDKNKENSEPDFSYPDDYFDDKID